MTRTRTYLCAVAAAFAVSGYLARAATDHFSRRERGTGQPIGLNPESIAAARALARRVADCSDVV